MLFKVLLALCITVLMACGSEYIEGADTYIQIFERGETRKYICSVNNGYQRDTLFNGHLIGNSLNIEWLNKSFDYQFEDGGSVATFASEAETVDLISAASIPSDCLNNAMSITSFSPDLIETDELINISISFDYRSLPDTDISIYFVSVDSDGKFMKTRLISEFTSEGVVSSESHQTSITPYIEETDLHVKLGILMYEQIEGAPSKLIAYDLVDVATSGFSNPSSQLNTDCLTCEYALFLVPSPFN